VESCTERLIHKDYLTHLELTLEEACNLFDAFHYYGKLNTLESSEDMFATEEDLPLANHWKDFDEFLMVWDMFYHMSRTQNRSSFGRSILDAKIPSTKMFSKEQNLLFSNKVEFIRQACYLLSFFDSLSDYFEFEVEMIERGYPHWHRRAS
jgi:hypothetical protein